MKIEEHCASLERCQELRDLSVKQDAFWSWDRTLNEPEIYRSADLAWVDCHPEIISAFSVMELLIKLPTVYFHNDKDYHLSIRRDLFENNWFVEYRSDLKPPITVYNKNLANAAADMLISLIKIEKATGEDICPDYS